MPPDEALNIFEAIIKAKPTCDECGKPHGGNYTLCDARYYKPASGLSESSNVLTTFS